MRFANEATVRLAAAARPVFTVRQEAGMPLSFHCPNPITLWRAKTLFTKEPDTIDWIRQFSKDAILFDVGANIGVYSLFAAARGAHVYAFEPESQNYALLNRNIVLNQLHARVFAFNFALGKQPGIGFLQVSSTEVGSALHALGENASPYTSHTAFRQGVGAYTLDQLVYELNLPAPNHIKIDVDGIEPDIIAGASRLLADEQLHSILIELDDENADHRALVPQIEAFGLTLTSKKACPLAAGTRFESVFNHIFSKLR